MLPGMERELWIITEARLWHNFMAPRRGRLRLHSLSPERRREIRLAMAKQREQEFYREWDAYERWLQH